MTSDRICPKCGERLEHGLSPHDFSPTLICPNCKFSVKMSNKEMRRTEQNRAILCPICKIVMSTCLTSDNNPAIKCNKCGLVAKLQNL